MNWKPMAGALALATLAAAPSAGGAPPPEDPGKVFGKLNQEYNEAYGDYYGKLAELREKGASEAEVAEFVAAWDPKPYYADLFMEHAGTYAGTPDAYPFLQWVVRNPAGSNDEPLDELTSEALDTILAHHLDEPGFASFVGGLHYTVFNIGQGRTMEIIDRAQAVAEGVLADRLTLARGRIVMADEASPDGERGKARAALDALAQHEELGEQVRGLLFELDNLQIGMVAPDIEAADLEGVGFKLSDYRGKVVVLDFWGDW